MIYFFRRLRATAYSFNVEIISDKRQFQQNNVMLYINVSVINGHDDLTNNNNKNNNNHEEEESEIGNFSLACVQ